MKKFPYLITVYDGSIINEPYRKWLHYLPGDPRGSRYIDENRAKFLKEDYGLTFIDELYSSREVFLIENEQDELNYSQFCLEWG